MTLTLKTIGYVIFLIFFTFENILAWIQLKYDEKVIFIMRMSFIRTYIA